MIKPIFKGREIVVSIEEPLFKTEEDTASKTVLRSKVIYAGELCERYKAGDEVLFFKDSANQLNEKFFEKGLHVIHNESMGVICAIDGE